MTIKIKIEDVGFGDRYDKRYYIQEIPEGEPLSTEEIVDLSAYFTTENLSHLVVITFGESGDKEIHGLKGNVFVMDKNGNTIDKS